MKIFATVTAAILLGMLVQACAPAMAQVPPEELEITSGSYDDAGDICYVEVKWGNYSLNLVTGYASTAYFSSLPQEPDEPPHYLLLEPDMDCPQLELAQLPENMPELLRICVGMATSAMDRDDETSDLNPGAREILSLVSQRRFSIRDFVSYGSLSLTWYYEYRGKGRDISIAYRDGKTRFDVAGNKKECVLTLQESPSPYSAEITLKGGELTAKALGAGGQGLPDEALLLKFLSEITSRAYGLAASDYCGAPDDVVEMLERLSNALAASERFDSYEELEEAICPT